MYTREHCRTQYQQYSFLPRTIRDWNDPEVMEAKTIDTFVYYKKKFFFFFFFFFCAADESDKIINMMIAIASQEEEEHGTGHVCCFVCCLHLC